MPDLPRTEVASLAHKGDGAKLIAPSAARNMVPIADLVERMAPATGTALEIASGTGQHIVEFAQRLPGLHWQPTELAAERRASIDAYVAEAGLTNLSPARPLNAADAGWAAQLGGRDLIVLINLLHLISTEDADAILGELARALAPSGRVILYGPFMRDGALTSDGDARFHASIKAGDPSAGYKDDIWIRDRLMARGLSLLDVIEMPANNLAFVAEKPRD